MSYLVLDLETVPDRARWSPPPDVTPEPMAPPWAQRIVCAGFLHLDDEYRLVELGAYTGVPSGDPDLTERSLLLALSRPIAAKRPAPILVTWNGRGFDLPVIVMRALAHAVPIPWWYRDPAMRTRYKETGHLDLMDSLADHGAGKYTGLDAAARLIGLPGKAGVDGTNVADLHARGELDAIVSYCLRDVAQTALLLLRYRFIQRDVLTLDREHALRAALALDPRLAELFPPPPIAEAANGEPAALSSDDIAAVRESARRVVASVRNDHPMPAPFHTLAALSPNARHHCELLVLRMAQVITGDIHGGERIEQDLDRDAWLVAEAQEIAARIMAPWKNGAGDDPPPPTDEERLAIGFGVLLRRLVTGDSRALVNRCGWCVAAAGDDDAAWKAAPQYDLSSIKAHTLACPHNPLVKERNELVAKLAKYEPIVDAAKACRATRDEALKRVTPSEMKHAVEAGLRWQELFEAVAALESP